MKGGSETTPPPHEYPCVYMVFLWIAINTTSMQYFYENSLFGRVTAETDTLENLVNFRFADGPILFANSVKSKFNDSKILW